MKEYSLIAGFWNERGEFDVFAKIRGSTTGPDTRHIILFPTKESVSTRINGMLSKGLIAEDSEGYYLTGELE